MSAPTRCRPYWRKLDGKKESDTVQCYRPSKWSNPFALTDKTDGERHRVIAAYRQHLTVGDGQHLLAGLDELSGKRLACWCKPHEQCHTDVLIELWQQHVGE